MEEAGLTLAFLILLIVLIMIRIVLPIAMIVVGAVQIKKNGGMGKPLLIVGSLWLALSISFYIYSGIKYGL